VCRGVSDQIRSLVQIRTRSTLALPPTVLVCNEPSTPRTKPHKDICWILLLSSSTASSRLTPIHPAGRALTVKIHESRNGLTSLGRCRLPFIQQPRGYIITVGGSVYEGKILLVRRVRSANLSRKVCWPPLPLVIRPFT
jgi:hypothetical protein